MRTGRIARTTAETDILVEIDLDGTGAYDGATGIGFLDHMVEQFSRHSLIDVTLKAGDAPSDALPGDPAPRPKFLRWLSPLVSSRPLLPKAGRGDRSSDWVMAAFDEAGRAIDFALAVQRDLANAAAW